MKAKPYFLRIVRIEVAIGADYTSEPFTVPKDEKWRYLSSTREHVMFLCWKIDPSVDIAGIVWQCS